MSWAGITICWRSGLLGVLVMTEVLVGPVFGLVQSPFALPNGEAPYLRFSSPTRAWNAVQRPLAASLATGARLEITHEHQVRSACLAILPAHTKCPRGKESQSRVTIGRRPAWTRFKAFVRIVFLQFAMFVALFAFRPTSATAGLVMQPTETQQSQNLPAVVRWDPSAGNDCAAGDHLPISSETPHKSVPYERSDPSTPLPRLLSLVGEGATVSAQAQAQPLPEAHDHAAESASAPPKEEFLPPSAGQMPGPAAKIHPAVLAARQQGEDTPMQHTPHGLAKPLPDGLRNVAGFVADSVSTMVHAAEDVLHKAHDAVYHHSPSKASPSKTGVGDQDRDAAQAQAQREQPPSASTTSRSPGRAKPLPEGLRQVAGLLADRMSTVVHAAEDVLHKAHDAVYHHPPPKTGGGASAADDAAAVSKQPPSTVTWSMTPGVRFVLPYSPGAAIQSAHSRPETKPQAWPPGEESTLAYARDFVSVSQPVSRMLSEPSIGSHAPTGRPDGRNAPAAPATRVVPSTQAGGQGQHAAAAAAASGANRKEGGPQVEAHVSAAYTRGVFGGDFQLTTAAGFGATDNDAVTQHVSAEAASPAGSPEPEELASYSAVPEEDAAQYGFMTPAAEMEPSAECDSDIPGMHAQAVRSEAVRFLEVSHIEGDSDMAGQQSWASDVSSTKRAEDWEDAEPQAPAALPLQELLDSGLAELRSTSLSSVLLKVAIGGAFAYGQSPEVRAVVSPVAQFVGHSAVVVGSALGKGVVVSTHFVGERALHPLGKTVVDSSVVAGKVVSGKAAVVGKTVGEKALDVGKSAGKHAVDSTVSLAEQIAARIKLAIIGKAHAKRI